MTRTRRPQRSPSDPPRSSRTAGSPDRHRTGAPAPSSVHERRPHEGGKAAKTAEGVLLVGWLTNGRLEKGEGVTALETALKTQAATVWVDLHAPNPAVVSDVARVLGLHELIAEDILEGNQRAKIEVTDDLIHIVLFALLLEDEVATCEIDIVLGEGFLLCDNTVIGWALDSPQHSDGYRKIRVVQSAQDIGKTRRWLGFIVPEDIVLGHAVFTKRHNFRVQAA